MIQTITHLRMSEDVCRPELSTPRGDRSKLLPGVTFHYDPNLNAVYLEGLVVAD